MTRILLLIFLGLIAVALAIWTGVSWLSPLAYMVLFPAGALWLWKRDGHSVGELGFRIDAGWARGLVYGLLAGLAIPLLFEGLQFLGGWSTILPITEPLTGLAGSLAVLLIRMILIVLVEEFVFRGFFLQSLSPRMGFWAAALLSSLLWGAGHLASMVQEGLTLVQILTGMLTFLFWGLALAFSYMAAGKSLWLPYGLHLGINLGFSLIGLSFMIQRDGPSWWIGHPAWSPESGILGAAGWSILALVMYWLANRRIMKTS